jgi:aspartyl-tRNA(Asn)/glutamyl-tRNA(Gln) amidotransferase subunit A
VIDTLRLTAEEAIGLIERGEVSGAELHRAYSDAIAERDPELHAYLCTVDEPAGDGVPIALKDVISTRGVETTAASKILAGYKPVFDATVAARCKDAGLPLLGKTNLDEFAMGSSTENSAYGPTRNPWDPGRVPGGSSGGSTAAVAAGLAPWALGSDTGGSIKQPAALCGVVGLRPTYGTVSRFGIVAFASSLDQVGPIAKTVRDCALLHRVIAGRDPATRPPSSSLSRSRSPRPRISRVLRIGVPKELNEAEGIEPGVTEAVNRTIELARQLGAEVAECRLPRSVEYGLPCYYLIAPSEASSNLARYDGVRYGLRVENGDVARCTTARATPASATSPSAGSCSARTRSRPATTRRTTARRRRCARSSGRSTTPPSSSLTCSSAPRHQRSPSSSAPRTANPLAMYAADLLTIPSNMAGLPGLSIPCGLSEGLPVGFQLIGPQFSENLLFRAGHALERAIGFDFVPEHLK